MKKQTFLICFENIDGIAVNFERWTFKSIKTCIKKTISKKEKLFWSWIWNNAERVLSNCVVYERK